MSATAQARPRDRGIANFSAGSRAAFKRIISGSTDGASRLADKQRRTEKWLGSRQTEIFTRIDQMRIFLSISLLSLLVAPAAAQQSQDDSVKIGYVVDVPVPLGPADANRLLAQLSGLHESSPEGGRVTVVLRYQGSDAEVNSETQFEDALKVARAMTTASLRRLRVVSLVDGVIGGHEILPIIASDMLLVTPSGGLANASAGDSEADETIELNYRTIAAKRGLFPPAIVAALVDPGANLPSFLRLAANKYLPPEKRSANFASPEKCLAKKSGVRPAFPCDWTPSSFAPLESQPGWWIRSKARPSCWIWAS